MRYTVLQPFKTPIHRFVVSQEVDDSEIDGPLTALDWANKGFLGAVAPAEEDLTALHAEAAALGIEIDGRWGAARLREEIETKKAAEQKAALALAEKADAAAAPEIVAEEETDTSRAARRR